MWNPLHPEGCRGCSFDPTGGTFVPPDEHGDELVVWGEAPGAEEAREKRGFVGASGRLLRGRLLLAGLKTYLPKRPLPDAMESVRCTNTVLCRPPGNKFPGPEIAEECLRRHQQRLLQEPLPWLACGANATEALTGLRLPVLSTRGSYLPTKYSDRWLVSTVHPAALLPGRAGSDRKSMSHLMPFLLNDIVRAKTVLAPRIPRVFVREPDEIYEAWKKAGRPDPALDIEGGEGNPTVVGLSWDPDEAWVSGWGSEVPPVLTEILKRTVPVLHNASYDIPELEEVGVEPPRDWIDTINLAAVYNYVQGMMGLESQVLTHVAGSVTWKGLVNHQKGWRFGGGRVAVYERLWSEVLRRLGRQAPQTRWHWYLFYNGLDNAWTKALALALRERLEGQGRMEYYRTLVQPLQRPVLRMGLGGLPCDPKRIEHHREGAQQKMDRANAVLRDKGRAALKAPVKDLQAQVTEHERRREQEKASGSRAYSEAKVLTSLRNKLRTAERNLEGGFDPDSAQQKIALLYDHLGLPEVRHPKSKNRTAEEKAIASLVSRLERGTIKPKRGTREEALEVCRAIVDRNHWAHWLRTYLDPPLQYTSGRRPRIITAYALHRTAVGRFSSGLDSSDVEKGKRQRQANVMNWPKELRDIVVADPGHVLIGVDWRALHWCICMMLAAEINDPPGYHQGLLDRFNAGELDPHTFLASHFRNVPVEEVSREERQTAKAYTYGRMFQGSERGLAREAGHKDRVGLEVCAAHDRAFKLQVWWEHTLEEASRKKYVQSPAGWRRCFWDLRPKPTEILATKIQEIEGDLLKFVLASMTSTPMPVELLSTTHDSLLAQSPEESAEDSSEWMKTEMEQPIPFLGWNRFRVDAKIGRNWKEVS